VDHAVRRWPAEVVADHPGVLGIGCLGLYARGDWGVGSDLVPLQRETVWVSVWPDSVP